MKGKQGKGKGKVQGEDTEGKKKGEWRRERSNRHGKKGKGKKEKKKRHKKKIKKVDYLTFPSV